MRILLAFAAILFLATFAPMSSFSVPAPPANAHVWAQRVPLDERQAGKRRLGGLAYLDGWWLRSDDRRFGGISAMHVEDGAVTALSDTGTVTRFSLPTGRALSPLRVEPLVEGAGPPSTKLNRDSEAMAIRGEQLWAVFERSNSVWRYDRETLRAEASSMPVGMKKWSSNSGGEAIVRLADGRFLIFSEGRARGKGATDVVLFDGDPAEAGTRITRLAYRAPVGYRITDAALLPDGRILYLNRRFSILEGLSAKLLIGTLPKLEAGALLTGKELAHFAPPTIIDNMEAVSVTVEAGRAIVWIASDDNFNPLQRTLLLKFALTE